MQPLRWNEIVGTWATILLPLNDDDRIDFTRLAGQIDTLIGSGVSGLYSNGTAAEFYSQSEDEFDRISSLLAGRCQAAGMPFQLGASHTSPQTSLERIRRSVSLKPGAFQVILPDWYPVTDAEAITCLARFAEAAHPVGLVLYNPPHAKRVLTPAEFGALKQAVPALRGIKVADGDEAWYAAMREHCRELSVFVPGHRLASGIARGAAGSYSNVACLNPTGAQRWFHLMKSNPPQALEIERRIQAFLAQHILPFGKEQGYCNAALDKLLAAIGGWANIGTRLRWPYRFIPQAEAARLRPVARQLIPELFALDTLRTGAG